MDLNNKVAIVTGASKGIGKEIAITLSSEGCNVVLIGRNEKALISVAKECEKNKVETLAIPFDLTNLKEIPTIITQTINKFNKINIVVNNAGMYVKGNPYEFDSNEWDKALALNLQAPYHLTNYAIKEIPSDEDGAIIFISSIAGKITYEDGGSYCMTKHGLTAYANCLFSSLREKNIIVTTLSPGFVNTELGREDNLIPEKMIQPEEFAQQVLFVLKNSNSSCIRELVVSPRRSPYK